MKISTIGTGNMARYLGILWAEQGHEVFFGSRDSEKAKSVAEFSGYKTQGGTNDQAAAFGDVIFYSVRELPSIVLSSTEVLSGKVLIDCNNQEIPEGFAFEPISESLAEKLAADVPNTHVVKAFNTMAQEVFEFTHEVLQEYNVSCFICSNNQQAKETVMTLAEEIGFFPVNCGSLRSARMIEGLGDFIRFMIAGMELGPYATISVHKLPEAKNQRLGGRQTGYR
ncbi:MAG: NADPH-dependent F420 reductase [Microcystaceae cyanobacterium]